MTAKNESQMTDGADAGKSQGVVRALAVLTSFLNNPQQRVSDVAEAAGLNVSTASRLLATLEGAGFLDRDSLTGLYRPGELLISLGGAALNRSAIYRHARQVAQDLASETGLGVNVAVRRGTSILYLLNREGRLAPRPYTLMGQRKPLHATGLGKCLLLDLSPQERRNLLPESDLRGFTPHTTTSHTSLDAELAEIARRAYATEREELAPGRACVAAPIRGQTGRVVAALSVSGPLSALDLDMREAELAQRVIEVADQISVAAGYLGPHQVSAA
jgi:DNA-binding IclR family transcriptional regulator